MGPVLVYRLAEPHGIVWSPSLGVRSGSGAGAVVLTWCVNLLLSLLYGIHSRCTNTCAHTPTHLYAHTHTLAARRESTGLSDRTQLYNVHYHDGRERACPNRCRSVRARVRRRQHFRVGVDIAR